MKPSPFFVKYKTFTVEKVARKFQLIVSAANFQKLPNVNNRPIGESLPRIFSLQTELTLELSAEHV
jgi:hypothetical protein